MSPTLWIGLGTAVAAFLGGWTVRDWKADSDQLEAQTAIQEAYREKSEEQSAASLRYEILAQQLRSNERSDRVEIRTIYRDVEVPSECAAPPSVSELLDSAVERANAAAAGEPVSPVPSTSAGPAPTD